MVADGRRRSSSVSLFLFALSSSSVVGCRHCRHRPLSFPRAHVRTNGCPCICKSGAVFGSPSASHLSMSRRERRIHGNTPGRPGVRVRASTSERRGQSLGFARLPPPPAKREPPGSLPPLPLPRATRYYALSVSTLCRYPSENPTAADYPPATDSVSSIVGDARASALASFVTPEDATLTLGGASGRAAASCFRH